MSEIPRQVPLNYQYTLQKIKDRKIKQVLSGGELQWGGKGIRKG
jgi:hypothetical protein